MKPPFPAPISEWHNNTYPAISPTSPSAISIVTGKRIVITGGGAGIGREVVKAFAAAGASKISILGRTESALNETKKLVEKESPKTNVSIRVCDVTKEADVQKAREEVGEWDVLVLNAGYLETPRRIEDADVGDWWKTFEVNVLGPLLLTKHFLPSRSRSSSSPPKLICTSAGLAHVPPASSRNLSGYCSSKLATLKVMEILAAETPDLHVVSFHPGVIATAMLSKGQNDGVAHKDDGELHFSCSPKKNNVVNGSTKSDSQRTSPSGSLPKKPLFSEVVWSGVTGT